MRILIWYLSNLSIVDWWRTFFIRNVSQLSKFVYFKTAMICLPIVIYRYSIKRKDTNHDDTFYHVLHLIFLIILQRNNWFYDILFMVSLTLQVLVPYICVCMYTVFETHSVPVLLQRCPPRTGVNFQLCISICIYMYVYIHMGISNLGNLSFNSFPPGQNGRHFARQYFLDAFSWMKSILFWLKFHRSLFPRVQLTMTQHWFR